MPWEIVRDDARLVVAGQLRFDDAARIWAALQAQASDPGPQLDLDLSRTEVIDSAITAFLVETRNGLLVRGVRSEFVGLTPRFEELVHVYGGDRAPRARPTAERPGAISRLGLGVMGLGGSIADVVSFFGELASTLVHPGARPNIRAVPSLIVRAGFDAVPIVVVLELLVGVVMAIQTAHQLQIYGANIFVADVVGLSITRELGPLITATILAGRSGAAFTAELGTMRVSEEIDALRTLGFAPMPYLVVPRIVALAIVAPILSLIGDVAAVAGGAAAAGMTLGVSPAHYLTELKSVLTPEDVWTGLVKSIAFGIAIALIGCRRGLLTRGAAAEVGNSTTRTIVECLFAIVIIDTGFTIIYRGANL